MGWTRRTALAVIGLVLAAAPAGCGTTVPGSARPATVPEGDRALINAYVEASNRAGEAGPPGQVRFLRGSQADGVPFPPDRCFGELTLDTSLVQRTLRPDPEWHPPAVVTNARRPDGAIYVVATAVSVRRGGAEVREDVGSKHFVIRGDRVFSYAPCAD